MKCLKYHIHNQQTKKLNMEPLPCAKTMAHGKGTNLCRVQKPRHTAKFWPRHHSWAANFFCRGPRFAHGKRFVVCPICGTRQRPPLPMPECRVSFAVCGTRQKLYRVHIGLCRVLWHTANRRFPVVIDYFDYSVRLHLALQLRLLRLLADASSTTLTTR